MYTPALLALAVLASALPVEDISQTQSLKSRSLQIVSSVAELQRVAGAVQPSTKYLQERCHGRNTSTTYEYGQADLINYFQFEFIANVSFGSQTFQALIDTGSSDTWLVESGFTCVNQTDNSTLTEADCFFGTSGYTPDSSFIQIPDENFNISYADGEYLNGIMGYDSVTFSGIVVPKQEVGLASLAAWDGDGITSGLVGLAFPAITSAFAGTNASADNFTIDGTAPGDHEIYSPIINTIFFIDNLTLPQFSLALSRDESNTSFGGLIAIGGYPDPTLPIVNATGSFASTPIVYLTDDFLDPGSVLTYQFYTINIGGLTWESDAGVVGYNNTATQIIVDSGTTLNYLPTEDADAVNAAFDPPAVYSDYYGAYVVACNATPPSFGVMISEEIFLTNPLDLILDAGDGTGTCTTGIDDGGEVGPFILGDVFLKNVLAVFDQTPGNYEMHFSPRVYYES